MDEWFHEIRECAERDLWSRGVELARGDRVEALSSSDQTAELRVRDGNAKRTPRVTLFFEGGGWECDCGSADDPCEHVTAAAIAWRRSRRDGVPLEPPAAEAAATLSYELVPSGDGLVLRRFATRGAGESATRESIASSLRAILRGRVAGPAFEAEDADWEIDELLGDRHRDPIPRGLLPALIRALRGRALRFGGHAIEVAAEPLRAALVVEDAPGGFRLSLRSATRGAERIAPGLALREGALHAVDEGSLSGRERDRFKRGHFVANDDAQVLAGETLPDLEGRIALELRSKRLPRGATRETPRLVVSSERVGASLQLRADIVYGDPPRARIEGTPPALVALGGALPIRDNGAEERLARRIHHELALPVGATLTLTAGEALEAAARLRDTDATIVGRGHLDFFRAPPLQFALGEVAAYQPRFVAENARGKPYEVSAAGVVAAWERGESAVVLDGGGLAAIPREWLARHGRILASFLEARSSAEAGGTHEGAGPPTGETPGGGTHPAGVAPTPPLFCAIDWALLCEAEGEVPPAQVATLRERLAHYADDGNTPSPTTLPDDLRGALRDYQTRGVAWLGALRDAELGALLADDMGLGKTLQVLCALRGRALVVAPTSVLANWRDEIQRFRPSLRVCLYHGTSRSLDPDADLTLTSYAILRRDLAQLGAQRWDVAVLDEAQAIKNAESQAAQAAYALCARWRVSLTGTPVENRLDELWSQLHFLNPGHMGARRRFQERYAKPIEAGDEGAARELRGRIRPFVLRRLKSEVARELPPRTDLVRKVELDDGERAIYEALRVATRREFAERFGDAETPVVAALEALLRLRQASCHSDLIPGQDTQRSSKVDALVESLETAVAEGHKALVFSQWTGLLDRIEPHLRATGLRYARLDGSTRDRAGIVASFQREDGPPVFLISLRAGGTGLNLTAADHVFLMDPWWNPAVEEQAADRAHRIGQDKPVFVHRLVATDTVEEKMLALKARKLEAARSALADTAGGAPLGREELLALLD